MRAQLERLHGQKQPVSEFSYDDAARVAGLAESFVLHPYWDRVSRMLSKTIQAETEELLGGNAHEAVNRASVAICRKVLQMPFIDIEQGRMATEMYEQAKAKMAKRRSTQRGVAAEV